MSPPFYLDVLVFSFGCLRNDIQMIFRKEAEENQMLRRFNIRVIKTQLNKWFLIVASYESKIGLSQLRVAFGGNINLMQEDDTFNQNDVQSINLPFTIYHLPLRKTQMRFS
jgi:hypothetical protein